MKTATISMAVLCAALAMGGCAGDAGPAGQDGTDGAQGPEGPGGPEGPTGPGGLPLAIQLPGPNFFPEGIAIDGNDNFYVGSLTTGDVITGNINELRATVLTTGALAGAIGMVADDDLGGLWVCEANLANPTVSRVVLLDIASGAVIAEHAVAPAAAGGSVVCNDVALDGDNNVFVTDSLGGQIFRVAADERLTDDSAQLWVVDDSLAGASADDAIGVNGIFQLGAFVYALNTSKGTLLRIAVAPSGDAGAVTEVALRDGAGGAVSLSGGDGLESIDGDTLIAVDNRANRLVAIDLGDVDQATPQGTVRTLATRLDFPTTVAVGPDGFAYVVESQFDHLLDPITNGPPALPFGVVRVDLFLSGSVAPLVLSL